MNYFNINIKNAFLVVFPIIFVLSTLSYLVVGDKAFGISLVIAIFIVSFSSSIVIVGIIFKFYVFKINKFGINGYKWYGEEWFFEWEEIESVTIKSTVLGDVLMIAPKSMKDRYYCSKRIMPYLQGHVVINDSSVDKELTNDD